MEKVLQNLFPLRKAKGAVAVQDQGAPTEAYREGRTAAPRESGKAGQSPNKVWTASTACPFPVDDETVLRQKRSSRTLRTASSTSLDQAQISSLKEEERARARIDS